MQTHNNQRKGAITNLSLSPELKHGERVVSSFEPYYATSNRVLLWAETNKGLVVRELPYEDVETIDVVKTSNHGLLGLGSIITIIGLVLAIIWGFHLPLLIVALGLYAILLGAVGKPSYYQILGRDMPRGERSLWQVRFEGAGSFVATIRIILGEEPHPSPGRSTSGPGSL